MRTKFGCLKAVKSEEGSISTEFALCAMPFIVLLFGIIETAFIFFTSVILDGATIEAGRKIRTGELQEADDQVAAFSEFLCEEVYGTVSCDDLSYVVSTFDDFASISFEPMFDEDGNPIPPEFDAGSAGDIVVVRVSYKWNLFTPFLSSMYGRSSFELVSTAVFRSEPYDGPI